VRYYYYVMAQPRRVEANWQLPSHASSSLSVSHHGGGGSSTQTSESGQATPATGSASDFSDRDGLDDRGGRKGSPSHGHGHSRDHRLPLPSDNVHHDLSAGGGYGSGNNKAYELEEFHDHNVYDGDGENAIDDGDYANEDDEVLHGEIGRNRGGNGTWGKGKSSRRLSDSTAASFQLYTPDEENAVIRKFDRKLVVFLAFCYMLSFVDRSSTFLVHFFYLWHPQLLLERCRTCYASLCLVAPIDDYPCATRRRFCLLNHSLSF